MSAAMEIIYVDLFIPPRLRCEGTIARHSRKGFFFNLFFLFLVVIITS